MLCAPSPPPTSPSSLPASPPPPLPSRPFAPPPPLDELEYFVHWFFWVIAVAFGLPVAYTILRCKLVKHQLWVWYNTEERQEMRERIESERRKQAGPAIMITAPTNAL